MTRAAIPLSVTLTLSLLAPAADPPARVDAPGDPLPAGAVARFGVPRFQHDSIGGLVAFSPDGTLLATGGNNRPICVYLAQKSGYRYIWYRVSVSPSS